MSVPMSREQKTQDIKNTHNPNRKCRIPQRLNSGKQCPLSKFKEANEKPEIISLYQPGFDKEIAAGTRSYEKPAPTVQKRNLNDKLPSNRSTKAIIIVPKEQNATNKKCKLSQEDFSDAGPMYDSNENNAESTTLRNEKLIQLKNDWQEKRNQFEIMRNELIERQNMIIEAYAALQNTQEKLSLLGQKTSSPLNDDLRIMNVAQMTPQQLLQLCTETKAYKEEKEDLAKNYLNVDLKKINNIPSKIFATCEQALAKRKELIDWFENLKNNERECSKKSKLGQKINELNAENDTLHKAFQAVKIQLVKDLNEITNILRKCVNETIAVSLRNEDLTYELSELNSQNGDLQKQIYNKEHLKSHSNKAKIEELEKKLKEEKGKSMSIKERLIRTERQANIFENRAVRLEASLDQARTQGRNLERTIQNLRDQNQQLQKEFDEELRKLNESINENSRHLEEIADARTKLQNEKEDLEKRLTNLSQYYNESINNMKHEISDNIKKIIETEKKYNQEMDEKVKLQTIVENQCAQLIEAELRNKDTLKLFQDTETKLADALNEQKMKDKLEIDLVKANDEIEKYKIKFIEQSKAMEEMQKSFKSSCILEGQLRDDINNKSKYIEDLEKKLIMFEHQTKDSELKMQFYENQLLSLKEHIGYLKENFGEFENMDELNDLIIDKNKKLNELSACNDKLSNTIQKQAVDLDSYMKTITEQEHSIRQKDVMILALSEKEKEQTKIIAMLNKKFLLKAEKDTNESQKIIEKNAEIKSLIVELETKDKQIGQLEKVIISLDDQMRKAKAQKKKYQDNINILEKVIVEYESYINDRNIGPPTENLDNLIKILENEMETAITPQPDENNFKTEYKDEKPISHKSDGIPCIRIKNKYSSNNTNQSFDYHSGRRLKITKNRCNLNAYSETEMHHDVGKTNQRKRRLLLKKGNIGCLLKEKLNYEIIKNS